MKLVVTSFKILLSTAITLLLLEGIVRVAGLAAFGRLHPTVIKARQALAEILLEPDPELLYRVRRAIRVREPELGLFYETNALGMRVHGDPRELPASKSERVKRIVCLGDSCTFGLRVAAERTYAGRLASLLLRTSGEPIEVWNLGVPGYSSAHGTRLARNLKSLQPDVVTIAYGFNDSLLFTSSAEADFDNLARLRWWWSLRRVLARSGLYQWLVHAAGSEPDDYYAVDPDRHRVVRVTAEQYESNLRAIIATVRAIGARVVLINLDLPNRFCDAPLARVAAAERVPLLVARDVFDAALGKAFGFAVDPGVAAGMARVAVRAKASAPYLMGLKTDRSALTPLMLAMKATSDGSFAVDFPIPQDGFEVTVFDGGAAGAGGVPAGVRITTLNFNYFVPLVPRADAGMSFHPETLPPWPYTELLAGDPVHPNARGHELIAGALALLVSGVLAP